MTSWRTARFGYCFRAIWYGLPALVLSSPTPAQVTIYEGAADEWLVVNPDAETYVLDTDVPGLAGDGGCLAGPPDRSLQLAGGVVTISGFDGTGEPGCAVADGATLPAVSDGWIEPGGKLVMEFDPPVRAFYTFFGSLALNETGHMSLFSEGSPVGSFHSLAQSWDLLGALAVGLGFTSELPIDRVELSTSDPGPVLAGAFVGLAPENPSLGTVNITGYQGPSGSTVLVDFGCVFDAVDCPSDLDSSGQVGFDDLVLLLGVWGPCADPCTADLDGSGQVGFDDLTMLLGTWGPC